MNSKSKNNDSLIIDLYTLQTKWLTHIKTAYSRLDPWTMVLISR